MNKWCCMKIVISVCCCMMILPVNVQSQQNIKTDRSFELSKNLEIFSAVYKTLYNTYVDDINEGDIVKVAIDAMLNRLDPYTNYYPENDIEDVKLQLLGEYGGIGALIHTKGDSTIISEPYEDMPAYKAGLKAGDIIISINGQNVVGKSNEQVRNLLRGQSGSEILLQIDRRGKKKEFKFKRESIVLPNVQYSGILTNSIGYIRLTEFTKNAAKNVLDSFYGLKKQNITGLILDLRGNGGGLLNEAIDIINIFEDKGQTVVTTVGKIEAKNQKWVTTNKAVDAKIPIVVLIDQSSASASEIVSGALQDLDRAVIVGNRSFGKGLVQNVIPLPYNAQMKVTVSKYYIPSGRCIQAIDYSHRDVNGRAVKIQDSLRTAFKTKGGRTVYDGYGIEPDVFVEQEYTSPIIYSMVAKFLPFDYATEYAENHPSIPQPKDFEITDEIYDDFVKFLSDKDYSYTTLTESGIKSLLNDAEKEKCDSVVLEFLKRAEAEIENDKKNDLYKFKDEIKELLLSEIVVRYYNQKGRTEAMLKSDKTIEKAVEILSDKNKYDEILGKK